MKRATSSKRTSTRASSRSHKLPFVGPAYCIRRPYGAMADGKDTLLFVGFLYNFTKRFPTIWGFPSDNWNAPQPNFLLSAAEAAAPTPLVQPRLLTPRSAVHPPDLLRGPGRGRPGSRGDRAAWLFDSWDGHSVPRAAVLTVRSSRDFSQTDVRSSCILAAQASRPRGPGRIAKNALLAPGAGGSTRISATRCRQEIA